MALFGNLKNRKRYVRGFHWPAGSLQVFPEARLASLANKENYGLAFSGGGTRAASATLGQLRALESLGVLDRVKYISAVSGGSWATAPFTYLPKGISDEEFLGAVLEPGEITEAGLVNISPNSLAHVISNTIIIDDFLEEAVKLGGDETYARAIGNLFLEPYGIGSRKRFFAHDEECRQAALDRNARSLDRRHHLKPKDFYLARAGRPFFIAGGTILTDASSEADQKIHVEFTGMYSGTHHYHQDVRVGGAYISNYAYDGRSPSAIRQGVFRTKLGARRHIFALSDMIGTSGAAPQEILFNAPGPLKALTRSIGFPEYQIWSRNPANDRVSREEEATHGDGGHLENLGIMPLLKRKVDRIIVFINSKTRIREGKNKMATSVGNLFRPHPDSGFALNIVFDDGPAKYQQLIRAFQNCLANREPLLHQDTYRVIDNAHFGVQAYDVRILWVYNNAVGTWRDQLNPEVSAFLTDNFPHYRTFFQNPPKIIDLSKQQVGLLAHQACWVIRSNEATFSGF